MYINTNFLDKTIDNFYKQENQLSILYKIFAAIALIISCLGLYGLVSFMTIQRTKEVGIRKVLGASFGHIVYLLTKEFTFLVLIAFVIATPLAYYVMHKWLQNLQLPYHNDGRNFPDQCCRHHSYFLDHSWLSDHQSGYLKSGKKPT